MLNVKLWLLVGCFFGIWMAFPKVIPEGKKDCKEVFVFQFDDQTQLDTIKLCLDSARIPADYQTVVNMAVCDDSLCARVILKLKWDLAGNYSGFDTLPGNPLTKFDHKKFTDEDYNKLDRILKDNNSTLRILEKNELIDKSIKLKATTVDAVTGATPATVKNAAVEGAVYTSYSLWHLVNGALGDSIRAYTLRIYSEQIARRMLESANFETQLFALKRMTARDYGNHSEILFQVIRHGVPLIKAYIISKMPLPSQDQEKNKKFVSIFSELDGYSKSIFLNRITGDKQLATVFLPLMKSRLSDFDNKQLDKYLTAYRKFGIPDYPELQEK